MLKKFVFYTGASDYLVGLATWGGAIQIAMLPPDKGRFVPLITLGTFLLMAAACLVWASRDLEKRAPVVFWQGLVRLSAIAAVLYAVPNAMSETWEYGLLAIDGPIGLTYVIGSMRITGKSFFDLLLCRE